MLYRFEISAHSFDQNTQGLNFEKQKHQLASCTLLNYQKVIFDKIGRNKKVKIKIINFRWVKIW